MWNSITFFTWENPLSRMLLCLFLFTSLIAFGKTNEMLLENGLKIIVLEDHRAPIAVTMVWYHVGSGDEPQGLTGVSHFLEHLMFKGTEKYKEGEFQSLIAREGGESNAFTNHDYTAYINKVPVSALPLIFELEADRMNHLTFNEASFEKERKVVQEERRLRIEDYPIGLAFERYLATAHLSGPYHHPIIGWMSDLEQINIRDAKAWYQHFYAPNHATLVVVGDVLPEEIFKLAQTHFGKLPRNAFYLEKKHPEPPLFGAKTVDVEAPTPMKVLFLGFPTQSFKTAASLKTPATLELIRALLDGGEHARLSKNLIHQSKIASKIDVHYNPLVRYDTDIVFIAIPEKNRSLDNVKQSILSELKKLRKENISKEELTRAKNQLIAQKTFEKDAITAIATEIGLLDTLHLPLNFTAQWITEIKSITAEDIEKVALETFNLKKITETRLVPTTKRGDLS